MREILEVFLINGVLKATHYAVILERVTTIQCVFWDAAIDVITWLYVIIGEAKPRWKEYCEGRGL